MKKALILLLLPLCLLLYLEILISCAEEASLPTSSPPEAHSDSATVLVNPNPNPGSVYIYTSGGKLEQAGTTRAPILLKPGSYTVVVISNENFFSFWKGEADKYFSASRNYAIAPLQKKMMRWDRVFWCASIALLFCALLASYFVRIYVKRKISDEVEAKSRALKNSRLPADAALRRKTSKVVKKDLTCWELQRCHDSAQSACEAFKKNLNCWDSKKTPCCTKDRAFCIICPIYSKRMIHVTGEPAFINKELLPGEQDTSLIEKLSNPHMMFITELSRTLSSHNTTEDLGSTFLQKISEVLICESGMFLIADSDREYLLIGATFNWGDMYALKESIKYSPLLNRWAAENQFPMSISQASKDRNWLKFFPKEYERSLLNDFELIYPLIGEGKKLLAVLLLGKKRTGSTYLSSEYDLLKLAARMITISFEKTISYRLATLDGLTNLYVVRFFRERLTEELKSPKSLIQGCSLIMIDIDHFKRINDTFGHQQGDTVLKEVAAFISGNLRAHDLAARYGGEEMAVILPCTEKKAACEIAERIRSAIAGCHFSGLPEGMHVTVSLGVASYPQDAQKPDELIQKADQALYRAKNSGRNRASG